MVTAPQLMSVSSADPANVCFSWLTLTNTENQALNNNSLKWSIMEPELVIQPERWRRHQDIHSRFNPPAVRSNHISDQSCRCGAYLLIWWAMRALSAIKSVSTDETYRTLLKPFSIGMITSDGGSCYAREVPKNRHLVGRIFTRRIEHLHLTLRSRIKRLDRKTICFSRSVEIHEKVIGSFIEKHMLCWLEPSPENIRQLNNNDFFFMGSHTLSHTPLKISHQLTNTSSEICIKLIA